MYNPNIFFQNRFCALAKKPQNQIVPRGKIQKGEGYRFYSSLIISVLSQVNYLTVTWYCTVAVFQGYTKLNDTLSLV